MTAEVCAQTLYGYVYLKLKSNSNENENKIKKKIKKKKWINKWNNFQNDKKLIYGSFVK